MQKTKLCKTNDKNIKIFCDFKKEKMETIKKFLKVKMVYRIKLR